MKRGRITVVAGEFLNGFQRKLFNKLVNNSYVGIKRRKFEWFDHLQFSPF